MNDFATSAKRILDNYLKHDPIEATLSGLHDYDCELPDMTSDGFAASHDRTKAYLAALERYDAAGLAPADRIDHALLWSRFSTEAREDVELKPHKHLPSLYPDTAVLGIYSLLAHDFAPMAERLPAIAARLEGIPAILTAGRANLVRSPSIWTEIAIEEAEGGIDFLQSEVAPLCNDRPQMKQRLDRALDAFHDYGQFLSERHARANGMSFSIGRDLFDFKLRHEHLLPYDTESLLAFGEEAVRSTIESLVDAARRIDPAKSWVELIEVLRTDHPEAPALLTEYRRSTDEARQFVVDRRLVTLPADDHLDVVETPAFLRPTIPYAAYMPPGAFEARQRGLYYVTPVNQRLSKDERTEQLLGHNRYGMLLTTVHESYPGHHLQLAVSNQNASTVRRLMDSSVFCEGWALYCEQMVLDEGMTEDPRTRLFQLKDQLWRACRIVIDVKLHTDRMTFEEAVAMLVEVAQLERPNAIGEARRYTQSPTQPMSYLTGKQQIMELRAREKTRLAAGFDLRAFHDKLLSFGTIPISLIEPAFTDG